MKTAPEKHLLTTFSSLNKVSKEKKELLKTLTSNSKDIYNKSLYSVRQHFFETNTYLSFKKNYQLMMTSYNKEETFIPYYRLQSNCSQTTVKCVDGAFKSFFSLLRKKKSTTFEKKVSIPKYLPKDGHYKVIFTKSAFSIQGKYIKLSLPKYLKGEELWFTIPKNIINKNALQEVHILPNSKGTRFHLAFIYKAKLIDTVSPNESFLSMDLGINNLVSMVNSTNGHSVLIDGKDIKSMNRFINKKIALLQSINKTVHNVYETNATRNLYQYRNNVLKDKLHKISTYIINYCKTYGLNTIVIGYNKEWKQDINIGKVNNQKFMNIPHAKLIEYITYKANMNGINVLLQEESYTSKCDSLALEPMPVFKKAQETKPNINSITGQPYCGKRMKRGLFQSSVGKLMNADINGALNIARKYLKCTQNSYEYIHRILNSGLVFNPVKVRI